MDKWVQVSPPTCATTLGGLNSTEFMLSRRINAATFDNPLNHLRLIQGLSAVAIYGKCSPEPCPRKAHTNRLLKGGRCQPCEIIMEW